MCSSDSSVFHEAANDEVRLRILLHLEDGVVYSRTKKPPRRLVESSTSKRTQRHSSFGPHMNTHSIDRDYHIVRPC